MKKKKKLFVIVPLVVLVLAASGWELFPRLSGLDIFPPISRTQRFQRVYAAVSETAVFQALAGFVARIRRGLSAAEIPADRSVSAVAVGTEDVTVGPLREAGHFSGSLKARSQFILSTQVAARLERMTVDVGDTVKKGQAVAFLDDREYVAQVKQAQADLDVAQANLRDARNTLDTARNELRRVRTLFANKIASQTEKENAETVQRRAEAQYAVAQAQIRQKQAALDTHKERLDATRITAEWEAQALPPAQPAARSAGDGAALPPSGADTRIVGERFVDPGVLLKANDAVVSIIDLSSLTATINITEAMYSRMQTGLPARAETDALPGRTFEGMVERIAPLLNQTSRQAEVRIGIPNPAGELKPGMFVRVSIEYSYKESAVMVPASSLVRRDGQDGVFLLSEDARSVRFVPVTLGITDNNRVEIMEPRISGKVITLGNHLLQDGSEVFIP
jgi:multidrug efflux pump subunit AcrA (membrane-fusion protein)